MIRSVLFVVFALTYQFSFGQLSEPLIFREKIHDFGNILEQDGPATFEFVVFNKSTRPVKIINVQPSCGCTTPDWTKEPIAVNGTGFIKASYDPKGRPGYFDKTLTITTDWDGTPVVLHIKGTVVNPQTANDPSLFSVVIGSLRFKSNSFNLGKVFINRDTEAISFPIRNGGKDSVHFKGYVSPRYIKVNVPKVIAPDQIANLKISFDAKLKNQYGFTSENIELKTDDVEFPEKSFSVYATTEEYFPKLSDKELADAPILSLQANVVNFGVVRAGAVLSREIKITNTGKKELIIRHAQSNCSCLTISPGQRALKPGQEISMKITLDTQGRTGPQNKSVTIYSTDPQNPVQRITFTTAVN
ncbi:MAG: DUF1573 domain-containing protein [Bacteroidetes bacterium]|nr:DUF1573 domain-containing protein [Bacteroidota bacterium]MBI3481458.1 DUF1573 domain-containing protein [Bacteroidota bacterium]